MTVRILRGDCREVLKTLPADSVHCCVSSPPYFALRDYGADGQIGLEASPEAFVAEIVAVFREVRRVLRPDGTLWLNLGDSYAQAGGRGEQGETSQRIGRANVEAQEKGASQKPPPGLKAKDLIGIPWRVAFALQADGWWLRQDIVWAKPNPMPESVTDRCTKSHEYLFLLTKSASYFYDADAISEPVTLSTIERLSQPNLENQAGSDRVPGKTNGTMKSVAKRSGNLERKPPSARGAPEGSKQNQCGSVPWEGTTRNKRSVWTVATVPFKEAHFATFPPALIEPCVLAGTSEAGVCRACGAPWRRLAEKTLVPTEKAAKTFVVDQRDADADPNDQGSNRQKDGHKPGWAYQVKTTGWAPGCGCPATDPVPATVLDPFGGAGTTGLVADRAGRDALLIELNPDYAEMAERRLRADAGLFAQVTA